ncbi:unnamed protein product [Coregonus sp. 'balchen']|nr:unnamed protein product [Coregonus sp. 'balchen']
MAALSIDPVEQPRMYQQTLLQDGLCDLLDNQKFVDCVLKIQDREFPCHRLVLAASSPFFKAMFLSNLEEGGKREIILKDVEPGEKLVLGNCLAIFRLGLLLDCPRLAFTAREFICERYQLILGPSELAAIITSDALNVDREEVVFESLMDWVGYDRMERMKELPDLLHCVRFRLIPVDYFTEKVEDHKWIRANAEVKKELQLIKDAHKGRLPEVKRSRNRKSKMAGDKEDEEDSDDEQGLLPGILNNNPRFGMFETDLILMISDTGSVAYDPVGNECFVASESTEIPKNHCSLVTKENQFDPMSGEWLGMPSLPGPRCLFEWKELAPMKLARSLFAVTVHNDQIYVATGVTDTGLTSTVEVYDIATNQWSEFLEFPQERSSMNMITMGECLYAVGGFAMMPSEISDQPQPTEMNDIWRFEEDCWNGILREISYAAGATILAVKLNTLRLTKM